MNTYHNEAFALMLDLILKDGSEVVTRNSTTKRLINLNVDFQSTPLISSRRTAWRNALREMEWFLSGSNNINDLHPKVHHWWKPYANKNGEIFNNYSKQFRNAKGVSDQSGAISIDQIKYAINCLKHHPYSRRNVITTWNTAEMAHPDTPITNCHGSLIQLYVEPDNTVTMTMYQRSCDMLVGVPHNWIQYWALLMWMCHQSGRDVGSFNWVGGDCHIYEDHIPLAQRVVTVTQGLVNYGYLRELESPELIYNPSSDEFKASDFSLSTEYDPIIKESAKMVV